MENHENHPIGCACCEEKKTTGSSRRDFLKLGSVLGMGLGLSPTVAGLVPREEGKVKDMVGGKVVQKGKAQHFTILHTADIHAQLYAHDEFFWEEGKAVYRKRGGMASLKTMLNTLRGENAANTLIIDGGDCFQGGGLASLTQGQAIVPMINNIGYDVMLPGNWEVVYGKKMMLKERIDLRIEQFDPNRFDRR